MTIAFSPSSFHYRNLAVIGNPVSHSLSPLIHNSALRNLNLPYFYTALKVETQELGELCGNLRLFNFRGLNVTVPHKVDIIPFLDELDPFARQVGAVNTVVVEESGSLKGYNTDGDGFLDSINHSCKETATGKKVVFIGAGGAVRGVAFRVASENPESIAILNRSLSKAEAICNEIKEAGYGKVFPVSLEDVSAREVCNSADWLVNGTSLGLKPEDAEPVPSEYFRRGQLAVDMIYNPPETKFLKAANRMGARPLNGLGMLVFQAAKSFQLWTGEDMPIDLVMRTLSGRG